MQTQPQTPLSLSAAPELIFGLVAPIGVDLDLITELLEQTLREMDYDAARVRLTELMREIPAGLPLHESPYVQSFKDRIAYANKIRQELGDEALAILAVSAIRASRAALRQEMSVGTERQPGSYDETDEEAPLPRQAYIIRQIKRPEEVALLRGVYGRQFILVAGYSPQELRTRRIADLERRSQSGLISDIDAQNVAHELVMQDARETLDPHGQNVGDAFPLGDVFIDATSRHTAEAMIRRFINALFGSNEVTPTHDEYGMYMAKSASLRSSDLSRQVGAAIFRRSGEVITLGCNEVPKAGGGTYWTGDSLDARDFVSGQDPNEAQKVEVLVDLLDRLRKGSHLSKELLQLESSHEIGKRLLREGTMSSVAESRVMDLLEFGRIIHAEMSAVCDAARKGLSVDDAVLYCTTFPCHICAKHIVASGVNEVVFLEPYPKSYATELHRDSIVVDPTAATEKKVVFRAFIGISPYRYRDLFEKRKRKYTGGLAQKWNRDVRRPMIEVYFPSYFKAEAAVVSLMSERLEAIIKEYPETTAPSRSKRSAGRAQNRRAEGRGRSRTGRSSSPAE
jgi:deoxycytidylate deaminase